MHDRRGEGAWSTHAFMKCLACVPMLLLIKLEQEGYSRCLIADSIWMECSGPAEVCEPDLLSNPKYITLLSDIKFWCNQTGGSGPDSSEDMHSDLIMLMLVQSHPHPLINVCKSVQLLLSSKNWSPTLYRYHHNSFCIFYGQVKYSLKFPTGRPLCSD